MDSKISFDTLCARPGRADCPVQPHQLPLYATSSFAFQNLEEGMAVFDGQQHGYLYSRFGNPTTDQVASRIAALELHGSEATGMAYLTSSGMAAIATLAVGVLSPGAGILTQGNLYGGTTSLFRSVLQPLGFGLFHTDLGDEQRTEQMLEQHSSIKMIYLETPANPTLACYDIASLAAVAHRNDCSLAVDNTFATPYLQQPILLGADFVVHSTTKYLNGHGNSIAGAIIGRDTAIMKEKIFPKLKLLGTNCSPWEAWLLHNGLKTLALRMERHCQNAHRLAQWLDRQPQILRVNYPGLPTHSTHHIARQQMRDFGGMLSVELAGGSEAGRQFMDGLQLCSMAPTLGDVDTLVMHPATMSHRGLSAEERAAQGITDGLVRFSVGIEDVVDLQEDLAAALASL